MKITMYFLTLKKPLQFLIATAVFSAGNAAYAMELRAALTALYPGVSTAKLALQYADECEPNEKSAHANAHGQWLAGQQLMGFADVFAQTMGIQAMEGYAREEQNVLLPKLRRGFPQCLNTAQLNKLYASDAFNLRATKSEAHQTVAAALGSKNSSALASDGANTKSSVAGQSAIASAPSAVGKPGTTASAITNTGGLEGVYLDQISGFNGFDFTAYAVFKDGSINSNLDAAFGGGSGKSGRPGRWQRKGNGFAVAWDNGKRENLEGSTFYRTFPASSGDTLNGKFVSLGTAGNVALGGNTLTFSASTIYFKSNGEFSTEGSSGGSSAGSSAVSRRGPSGGRYTLDGHTITMQYAGGKTVTTGFYFFPSKGRKDPSTIGVGNLVYSLRK